MFHSRKSNNKINFLHERALRMIYNDRISSFQDLLDKDNSFTVHHFNIQSLAIEMIKVINNIAATIIGDLFTTYYSYNLYLPHIIVTIFPQNLRLLFQVYVQFLMVKILYRIRIISIIRQNTKMEAQK